MLHAKKVGTLAVQGSDELKQTNEIKIAAPMLDEIEIKGRTITADALLTQRECARYLVEDRHAHYHFTVKANQKQLPTDLSLYFDNNHTQAHYAQTGHGEHGRIETRQIWTTTALNDYINFPHCGQVFRIQRHSIDKKTGQERHDTLFGITSKKDSSAEQILHDNRGHWRIESTYYIIDWNDDEDRSQIRKGFGPENMTRLRRFAIGVLKTKQKSQSIAEMMKNLMLNTRAVFDILKMTKNSSPMGEIQRLA